MSTVDQSPRCACGSLGHFVHQGKPVCRTCFRLAKMPEALTKRNVPPIYHTANLKDFGTKFPTDKPLFIMGDVGTGKTHLAVALLVHELMMGNHECAFVSMVRLLSEIKDTFNNASHQTEAQVIKKYSEIDTLVIDDIGVEKVSDWTLMVVYQIIDYRWSHGMHTIITSNLGLDGVADRLGDRIASRIGGLCTTIKMAGKDLRQG